MAPKPIPLDAGLVTYDMHTEKYLTYTLKLDQSVNMPICITKTSMESR